MIDDAQLSLDDLPRPNARATDPWTSHAAARLAEVKAGTGRAFALDVLRRYPAGLADFELAELTGWPLNSINKRRGELRDGGLVEATEETRETPAGAKAIVWRAVL
jgi:hypothetical protein